MDLQQFIDKYKNEALKIELGTNATNVIAGYREAITEPDFEDERQNAIETAKEMVILQKERLRHSISINFEDGRTRGRYIGCAPPYLKDLKIYLEYKELLSLEESQKKKPEFTLKQIALKYVYNEEHIERGEDANNKAEKHYHTSGQKLMEYYDFYRIRTNRKADPDETKKKLENKIELFESVIDLIVEEKQKKLLEDISILKSHRAKYQ